jgi:hypothetical protein
MKCSLIVVSAVCALAIHSNLIFADDNLPENIVDYCDWPDESSVYGAPLSRGALEGQFDCGEDCQSILGILPSDHCFDRFVSPLSNPFFFEDPRSVTEAEGIFLDNSLPHSTGGGDAQVWAAQIRLRFSDRWSLIAPRLGDLEVNQRDGAPHGFMSAPVGFKYNFYRDVDQQSLLSGGLTYFIPGSSSAFSNFGDGDVHFFLTGGQEIFDQGHWLSATGFRLPIDRNWGTPLWYWSNQWDYEVVDHWYGVFGTNWFHWLGDGGIGLQSSVTALDLIDIPAAGVAGTDVATCAAGIKWKPSSHLELGTGIEVPITERTDILRNRFYTDLVVRF